MAAIARDYQRRHLFNMPFESMLHRPRCYVPLLDVFIKASRHNRLTVRHEGDGVDGAKMADEARHLLFVFDAPQAHCCVVAACQNIFLVRRKGDSPNGTSVSLTLLHLSA